MEIKAENNKPDISVIIPVYNEEENIPLLYNRLKSTLQKMKKSYLQDLHS